ncbi:MAG: biotin synthase BioB [Dissulfurispiraceae bacterium]|jgi:biotin synthase
MIEALRDKVIAGGSITASETIGISDIPDADNTELFAGAACIRQHFRGDVIDLCAIVNAKSGSCPEDCSYCAQSSKAASGVSVYRLLEKEKVLEKAMEAKNAGVRRFCIVTSGRKVSMGELRKIGGMIRAVRGSGLLPCATLGLLNREELSYLRECGLVRYHHNLETSERFFPEICSTHTYQDKLRTIEAALSAGLSVCSGGIFGIGESWQDRVDMAFALKGLDVDSVPINFLIPVKGTPMGELSYLNPMEALKIIGIYRFILPGKQIRVCGGRAQVLGEFNSMVFSSGADAILTGNYLTTTGRTFGDDLELIRQNGLKIDR